MIQVNMLEAKTNFSKIIKILESREEDEIIIARDNKPVAKLVLYEKNTARRIGLSKGKYPPLNMDVFDSLDEKITAEFYGD